MKDCARRQISRDIKNGVKRDSDGDNNARDDDRRGQKTRRKEQIELEEKGARYTQRRKREPCEPYLPLYIKRNRSAGGVFRPPTASRRLQPTSTLVSECVVNGQQDKSSRR